MHAVRTTTQLYTFTIYFALHRKYVKHNKLIKHVVQLYSM